MQSSRESKSDFTQANIICFAVGDCANPAGPGNLAIVTLPSQLSFANDTPVDGEFLGRNALSGACGLGV